MLNGRTNGGLVQSIQSVQSTPALTASAKAVFRRLMQDGPSTRPQMGDYLGLSRPTMSAAIAELERCGYVEQHGAVPGALGRAAAQYRIGMQAGHVIAVDAGSTHVRLRVSTLDRRLLHSRVHRLADNHLFLNEEISRAVSNEIAAALAEIRPEWGPLRSLGFAVPTRVVGLEGDPSVTGQEMLFSAFQPPDGVSIVLENNVNCAAVAEQMHGAARERSTFAYIQIGLKVGMGLILENRLLHGHNGAAGEIGHMSFPFAPGLEPQPEAIERYLGTKALMERVRDNWPPEAGPPPGDTADLLVRAEAGDPAALEHTRRHARDIGGLVASCVSVVDPGLVVIGGGVGASPVLLPHVRETVDRLAHAVDVQNSQLGLDATVLGIEKLTVEHASDILLGELPA